MKGFYDKVSCALEEAIRKNYGIALDHPLWELPSRQEFGDLSSMAALKLASRLKGNPLDIAARIKTSLGELLAGYVDRIEILKPGFINIFFSKDILIDSLNKILKNKESFFRGRVKKKILLEFLSANPTGPLSVAHGRQAVIGDVIANVLEFCGSEVKREYYLNDAGRQIELFGLSVEAAAEIKGVRDFSFPQDGYRGEYIKDIAAKYLEHKEKGDIRKFALLSMISSIKGDLTKLGIKFDIWVSQKKIIDSKKVKKAVDVLRAKGLIYEREGALWFAATKFGDDKDRVIKKADGELTYFASDIAYHRDKAERKFDRLINLWGPDHHGYIRRVKTAMQALGYRQEILKVIIIQLVSLKTKERMSKRAGTLVLLSDLVSSVGSEAARFYYLTRKNSSHLEFDIDLAKEMSFNNPLYYIQYASARIESIFKKAEIKSHNSKFSKFLTDAEEIKLLRTLLQFSYCLDKAYYSLEPVFIVEFLKNLASSFHRFYERVKVLDEDNNVTRARLNLLQALGVVLHSALGLLGIKPAKKM